MLMKHQTPTIVLTGGGSGGHVTPLLSLARELKIQSPDCEIIYIGHTGDKVDRLQETSQDFDFMAFIKAGKFRRYHGSLTMGIFSPSTLMLNLRDVTRLPGSVAKSLRILRKFKPDVVFSKGGFVAVPVCAAAKLLGIPIITHDSDAVPGLANRLAGRWAKVHATGMPARYYRYPESSIEYVGIPLDRRIKKTTPVIQKQAKRRLDLPPDSRVLLVSGGGNGSRRLNELMLAVAGELLGDNLSLFIFHLSGEKHAAEVKAGYERLPSPARRRIKVLGFSRDFYDLVAAADIVISRAGATTLAELAAAAKPSIIIPAPFLTGGHQMKNAEELAKLDAVVVAPDEVQPDELLVLIKGLLGDDHRRFQLARNIYATAKTDAAAKLAGLILSIAAGER